MGRLSLKAIVIGGIADLVTSSVLGIPLVIVAVVTHRLTNVPREQLSSAVIAAIHGSPPLYAAEWLIGLGCSVLGGYVAGAIAKHDRVLNGLLSAILCTAIGIYSIAAGKSHQPLVVQLVLLVVATPLAALLGGFLSSRRSGASM